MNFVFFLVFYIVAGDEIVKRQLGRGRSTPANGQGRRNRAVGKVQSGRGRGQSGRVPPGRGQKGRGQSGRSLRGQSGRGQSGKGQSGRSAIGQNPREKTGRQGGRVVTAEMTIRDNACIRDPSKCKSNTATGARDQGVINGKTQCGDNPLRPGIVGLTDDLFGTNRDGVRPPTCGRKVRLTSGGRSTVATISDRVPAKYGSKTMIDVSPDVAAALGSAGRNIAALKIEFL